MGGQRNTAVVHDLGGHGDPLLICHATGLCGQAYEQLAAALQDHHHVYAVDLRGHGHSPLSDDDDLSWPAIAGDVLAAVEAIGGSVHLFGHSMGGAAALYAEATAGPLFATAFLDEPIVVGALMSGLVGTSNPMAEAARRRTEIFESKQAALWRYAARQPLDVLTAGSLQAYVEHGFEDLPDGTVRLRCRGETEARVFEATGGITTESVAAVSIPTVIATGALEASPLAALAPAITDAIRTARHVIYDDLGHFGPLQHPDLIARDVVDHIAGSAPRVEP